MAHEEFLEAVTHFNEKWAKAAKGRTLVVGSKCYGKKPDRRGLYEDAVGVDLEEGEGVDVVHDMECPLPVWLGTFSHIDCCSALEHVRKPWLMAETIQDVMEPGATILVTVPFSWRLHNYPGDYWRVSAEGLAVLFPDIEWQIRKYAIGNKLRNKVPGKLDVDGQWMARAELVAFGMLCK